jgi:hypothetical protein
MRIMEEWGRKKKKKMTRNWGETRSTRKTMRKGKSDKGGRGGTAC